MSALAIRSRLLQLQQDRRAARLGRELLDSKREAILRELLRRVRRRNELRQSLGQEVNRARLVLREACIECGSAQVDAALLSQPTTASVDLRPASLVGILMPHLQVGLSPFTPHYSTAATSARLDEAGRRFAALLAPMAAVAEEEEAVRNLQAGLIKTVRRLKALERVVIPRLDRDVRTSRPRSKRRNEMNRSGAKSG